MTSFVLLLRGVNVGKAKRISMGDLRLQLSGLGYTDVKTLLNSGNAVFRSPEGGASLVHASRIALALAENLGIRAPAIVKSHAEFKPIVEENPFDSCSDHSRLLVAICQDEQSLSSLAAVSALIVEEERFALGEHAAYLYCPSGILASKAAEALLGKAGGAVTTRNWATLLKLYSLIAP